MKLKPKKKVLDSGALGAYGAPPVDKQPPGKDIKNDKAVLQRVQETGYKSPSYWWRGWAVCKQITLGTYDAKNDEYGIRFSAYTLDVVRSCLPAIDAEAKLGTLPDRCRYTAERQRKEYKKAREELWALPLEERRAKANTRVVECLNKYVAAGEKAKQSFLKSVEDGLLFALEWAAGTAEACAIGDACAALLGHSEEPERFPFMVQHVYNEHCKQLVQDRYSGGSTSFSNAVDRAKRTAYSQLVAALQMYCLHVYKDHNVPTVQEKEIA